MAFIGQKNDLGLKQAMGLLTLALSKSKTSEMRVKLLELKLEKSVLLLTCEKGGHRRPLVVRNTFNPKRDANVEFF